MVINQYSYIIEKSIVDQKILSILFHRHILSILPLSKPVLITHLIKCQYKVAQQCLPSTTEVKFGKTLTTSEIAS